MKNCLRMLQQRRMAADPAGGGGAPGSTEGQDEDGADKGAEGAADDGKGDKAGDKAFTPEMQAAFDRRFAKIQKDNAAKVAEALAEGERRGKMTAEEKEKADREANQKALEDRERQITTRELRAGAMETLAEKGLPKTLADLLIYTDADACEKSLAVVETTFRAAVQADVDKRMKGGPAPGSSKATETDKDRFQNMSLYDQMVYAKDHPEKVAEFTK